ncbi:MAG: hypothetical protein EBQ82_05015 [Betaproteobacteria bacterium]|nr:hypothetical protein [Betaproteobacteria bacterium]NBY04756.1 hypothetical protein [Betaproteobacteria bacterium]
MGEGVYVSGPNCWKCHYFAVSWDPTKPYACRLMGFKSRVLPAMEVLRTDGTACLGFTEKHNRPSPKAAAVTPEVKTSVIPALTRRKPASTQMWEA